MLACHYLLISTKHRVQLMLKNIPNEFILPNFFWLYQNTHTFPYIWGGDVTEHIQRVMKKHHISTPVKPHIKLHQVLSHPKEHIDPEKKGDAIYEIPGLSCNKTYIGEMWNIWNMKERTSDRMWKGNNCHVQPNTKQSRKTWGQPSQTIVKGRTTSWIGKKPRSSGLRTTHTIVG